MIIQQVRLSNFSIYGGEHTFDLTPIPTNRFNRPIILFSGKNGVGKTSFVEAIRLCLHGRLALGHRVSLADYKTYLLGRIHRTSTNGTSPTSASVEVLFEHGNLGHKHTYQVTRNWRQTSSQVVENVSVLEDGQPPSDLEPDQHETFLRELIPPNITELFFFDGEKLERLAQDSAGNSLLAKTVKTLLGLNLVEQLQRDLDIYIASQVTDLQQTTSQAELQRVSEKIASLEQQVAEIKAAQQVNQEDIFRVQHAIADQEQFIASQGSWFAEKLDSLTTERQRLEVEIDRQRRHIQELSRGLMPFAITPQMTRLVIQRLQAEQAYQKWSAEQPIIEKITSSEFWGEIGVHLDGHILAKIKSSLTPKDMPPKPPFFLHISDKERETLLKWLAQAHTEIPHQFCQAIQYLNRLETDLQRVHRELSLAPGEQILEPLAEVLKHLQKELQDLQQQDYDLSVQLRHLTYELEQTRQLRRRIHEQLTTEQQHNQRLQLAGKTQLVLEKYAVALLREKIARLEMALVNNFNHLCRKDSFIDAAKIDPDTFKIILYRGEQSFERNQLSAGEKQLLAVAMMWALREVSGLPLPVIIDTPLGRLDSMHREIMVNHYFPRVSHQVILLATDTEIDRQTLPKLAPAISHAYYLYDDPTIGSAVVERYSDPFEIPILSVNGRER
jgi:DNA sulfur modification protein DndD